MNLKEIDIDIRIKGTVTVLSQDGISSGRGGSTNGIQFL